MMIIAILLLMVVSVVSCSKNDLGAEFPAFFATFLHDHHTVASQHRFTTWQFLTWIDSKRCYGVENSGFY